jgi:hypothetical protein
MAKDPWKNQPNYKIGGGTINEYEFNQQHGALTEQEHAHLPGQPQGPTGNEPDESPEDENGSGESTEALRIRRMMDEAREKVARRGGGRKASGASKNTAKKSGAKGAKKSGAKSGAGKGATKRSSGAKKSGAKKSAKKSAKKTAKKSGGAKGSKQRAGRGR